MATDDLSIKHLDTWASLDTMMSRLLASQSLPKEEDEDCYVVTSDYVSVFKFNGKPIPPPVLSLSCRREMQGYKEAAIKKEHELMERRRHNLLDTVQGIVDTIEVRKRGSRESTPPKMQEDTDQTTNVQIDMTLPDLTATQLRQYNQVIESMERNCSVLEYNNNDTTDLSLQVGSILKTRYEDDETLTNGDKAAQPPADALQCSSDITDQPVQTHVEENFPAPSVTNSNASSQDSALNSTVVAAKDANESMSGTTQGINTTTQSKAVDESMLDPRHGFFSSLHSAASVSQDGVSSRPATESIENVVISRLNLLHREAPGVRASSGLFPSIHTGAATKTTHQGADLSTSSKKTDGYFPTLPDRNVLANQNKFPADLVEQDKPHAQMSSMSSQHIMPNTESPTTEEGFFPPLHSTAITNKEFLSHADLQTTATRSSHGPLSLHRQHVGQSVKPYVGLLRDSWGDSESNTSLLGEYHLLPTPVPTLDNSNAPVDDSIAPVVHNIESIVTHEDDNMVAAEDLTTDDLTSMTATDKDCLTSSGMTSTHSHTLDTLAQSCTLPRGLFSNSMGSNSTLCEVQDPFSSSITSVTGMKSSFGVAGVDRKNEGLIRGAPVGLETSDTKHGAVDLNDLGTTTNTSRSPETKDYDSNAYMTPTDEFKLPQKRVRRNSYTLEHPSPALLDAQARNEAPYASDEGSPSLASGDDKPSSTVRRSLNLENNDDVAGRTQSGVIPDPPSNTMKESPVLTEDNLLRLQLEQFEMIRKQLEQKQREQIEEMLLHQQQEQLALAKEMSSLELRVNQQNSSKVYASVFGLEPSDDGDMFGRQQLVESNLTSMMIPVKRGSDTTNPSSLKDSLDNALLHPPPATIFTNSYTAADLHDSTVLTTNTNAEITTDSSVISAPFYLQPDGGESTGMDTDKSMLEAWTPSTSDIRNQKFQSPSMQVKFDRVSATVKGYLTRRLMRTHKVQDLMKTIRDTVYFVDDFQAETPIKQGKLTVQDVNLAERLLSQLGTARNDLYNTFQTLSAKERMTIIAQSRALDQQQLLKSKDYRSPIDYTIRDENVTTSRPLSAATLKVLERKNKAKKPDNQVRTNKQPVRTSAPKANRHPVKSTASDSRLKTSAISGDLNKPKTVIHRQTVTNTKNSRNSVRSVASSNAKSVQATNAVNSNAATGKKTKSVRRSLYPVTTKGPVKGPAKGPVKGTQNKGPKQVFKM